MSDFEFKRYQTQLEKLKTEGYSFNISSDGYGVWYKGEFVAGARVDRSREYSPKKIHWQHKKADLRDYLASACASTQMHKARHKDK